MKRLLGIAALGAVFSLPLHAADVFRWVDENGRPQISDIVPEKYRKSALKIDSHRYELSAEQRAEVDRLLRTLQGGERHAGRRFSEVHGGREPNTEVRHARGVLTAGSMPELVPQVKASPMPS